MNEHCGFLGKAFLKYASAWVLLVLLYESVYCLLVETCEYLDVALCIIVADVKPELVELVWRSALGVKSYIA